MISADPFASRAKITSSPNTKSSPSKPRDKLEGLFGSEDWTSKDSLPPPLRSRGTAVVTRHPVELTIDSKAASYRRTSSFSSNGDFLEELSPVLSQMAEDLDATLRSSSSFGFLSSSLFSPGQLESPGSDSQSVRSSVDSEWIESAFSPKGNRKRSESVKSETMEWTTHSDQGHGSYGSHSNASTSSLPLGFVARGAVLPPRAPAPNSDLPAPPSTPKTANSLSRSKSSLSSSVQSTSLPTSSKSQNFLPISASTSSFPSPNSSPEAQRRNPTSESANEVSLRSASVLGKHQPRSPTTELHRTEWSQITHPYSKNPSQFDRLSMDDVISSSFNKTSQPLEAQDGSKFKSQGKPLSIETTIQQNFVKHTPAMDQEDNPTFGKDSIVVKKLPSTLDFMSLSSPSGSESTSEEPLDSPTDPMSPPFPFDSSPAYSSNLEEEEDDEVLGEENLQELEAEGASSSDHGKEARRRSFFNFSGNQTPSDQDSSEEGFNEISYTRSSSLPRVVPFYLSSPPTSKRTSVNFSSRPPSTSFSSSSSSVQASKGVLPYSKRTSFIDNPTSPASSTSTVTVTGGNGNANGNGAISAPRGSLDTALTNLPSSNPIPSSLNKANRNRSGSAAEVYFAPPFRESRRASDTQAFSPPIFNFALPHHHPKNASTSSISTFEASHFSSVPIDVESDHEVLLDEEDQDEEGIGFAL